MIFITGDCHSDFSRFSTNIFYEQKEMTKDDVVIILGDFGGIWYEENSNYINKENYWLDWLNDKPFTTVFIDGNHENFNRLYNFPIKEWNGGKVHEIRSSIFHLIRGEIFILEGKKFFAFGGASSHDISDGILEYDNWRDEARKLEKQCKYNYRVKDLSWWEQELPIKEERENGINNLNKHNNSVDFILTHSPSASNIALLGHGLYEQDVLTKYLENIRINTNYSKWFSGHMHLNKQINDKEILLYEQIVRIL